MIDVAFAVAGDPLPLDHRRALADALERKGRGLPTRRERVCTVSIW